MNVSIIRTSDMYYKMQLVAVTLFEKNTAVVYWLRNP
jgi:hypothetical protein